MRGKDFFGPMDDEPFMEGTDKREGDEGEYISESALFLGGLIHEYLEKHHFGDPLEEELLKGIWERLIDSERDRYGLKMDTLLKLREKAFRQLKNTVYDKRLIKILGGKACYAEVPFLLSASRGIEFRGVIDRLSRDMDKGDWTITDWKSNDLDRKEPEDVAEENGYHLQLECYKWAVERILNEKVGRLYIYFTDKGYLLESRRQGNAKDVFNEMLAEIIEYEKNSVCWTRDLKEIKKDIRECRFCEYRESFCKEG